MSSRSILALALVLLVPLAGCGGGDDFRPAATTVETGGGTGGTPGGDPGGGGPGSGTPSLGTVSGQATKGRFLPGAVIRAFRVDAGLRGAQIGSFTFTDNGTFAVTIEDAAYQGTVLLEATGDFVDETTGQTQSLGSSPIRGVGFGLGAGGSLSGIQITPVTELAVALAAARGGLTDANLQGALAEVAGLFGIPSPETTRPAPTDQDASSATPEAVRYMLVIAGFSGLASLEGVPVSSLIAAAVDDASDGFLDGARSGQTILVRRTAGGTAVYDADTLGPRLAAGIEAFLRSPGNLTGLEVVDPAVTSVTSSLDRLNRAPTAAIALSPNLAQAGLPIRLDGRASSDPDGDRITYLWTVTRDGLAASVVAPREAEALFVSSVPGTYTVRLTVRDSTGNPGTATSQLVLTAVPPPPTSARLAIDPLQGPTTVEAGASFALTVPVRNTGESQASDLTAAIAFADSRVTAAARAANPTTVAASSVANLFFDVFTDSRTPPGAIAATVTVSGLDTATGGAVSASLTTTLPAAVVLPPPGPALLLSALTVPASVGQGRTATITVDVTNPGVAADTALITGARTLFSGSGVSGSLTVESARRVAPGSTVRLTFVVDVDAAAAPGARTVTLEVFGINERTGLPLTPTPAETRSLTVVASSRLRVTRLDLSASTVTVGTPIIAEVSLLAEGGAPASVSGEGIGLTLGSRLFPPDSNPAPATLQPGDTLSYRVTVDSSLLPLDTPLSAIVAVRATDGFTGQPVPVVQPAVLPVVLVQSPATLAITAFVPTPRTLSLGQTVLVELTVANGGSAASAATTAELTMRQGGADVTASFRIVPDASNPTTVPGNASATFRFAVTLPESGSTSDVTVTGTVSGRDANSGAALPAQQATLSWALQTPANVSVGPLLITSRVSQGQTTLASFTVSNSGEATARLISVSPAFNPPGGLSVAARANSTAVAGGATVTLLFDVTAAPSATPGTRTVDIVVVAEDVNSGETQQIEVKDAATLVVETPSVVTVVSVAGSRPANVGQLANPVEVRLRNDGQASAIIEEANLGVAVDGFNPRLVTALPLILEAGEDAFLEFLVDVPAGAATGPVGLTATVVAADRNTEISQTKSGSGSLLVQRRTVLDAGELALIAPAAIDRSGAPVPVIVRISNRGADSASMRVSDSNLSFTAGGTLVNGQYTVTVPPDLTSRAIAGGTTSDFTFLVQASSFATKRAEVMISIEVRVADANDGFASSQAAASSWVVREAATAVFGQGSFTASAANRGGGPGANSMNLPVSVATDGIRLVVGDLRNNRVLVFESLQADAAAIVLGQASLGGSAPSTSPAGMREPGSVFLSGQRLLVADRGNNRVLLFDRFNTRASGSEADVVLGQASFVDGLPNRDGAPAANTLNGPSDAIVAGTDLVVADTDNHRVLIYRNQASLADGAAADVVLGQTSFTAASPNRGTAAAGPATLDTPTGVAVAGSTLFVADSLNNRVLVWNDITSLISGQEADLVLGQASFVASQPNRGSATTLRAGLSMPQRVRVAGGRLLVADSLNNRVVLYLDLSTLTSGAAPDELLGQAFFTGGAPNDGALGAGVADAFGMAFPSEASAFGAGDIFVADSLNHRVLRIPLP